MQCRHGAMKAVGDKVYCYDCNSLLPREEMERPLREAQRRAIDREVADFAAELEKWDGNLL